MGELWEETVEGNCGMKTVGGTVGEIVRGTVEETVGETGLQDGIEKGKTTERLFYNGRKCYDILHMERLLTKNLTSLDTKRKTYSPLP